MVDQFFADPFFPHALTHASVDEGTLAVDLSEDDRTVFVRASVPGFKKEDVDIAVEGGVLTLNARHNEEKEEKTERFYRKERSMTSMSRRIALPTAVLEKDAQAELKDGVLTVRIPKMQKSQPQRVQIKST